MPEMDEEEGCDGEETGGEELELQALQDIHNFIHCDDTLIDYIPAPPDGGWGWVIVFASFMTNLVVDGIAYSFGLFMPEFQSQFDASNALTTAVGSVLTAALLMTGPIVSGLINAYGARKVTILGAVVACLTFFVSPWAPSILVLMVTYGIIGGFGFSLLTLPAVVQVGYYFEKKRALATGIAVSGSGVGTFIFAPLCVFLLEKYSWKGSLWIFAGLLLNGAVFGSLLRPLRAKRDPEELDFRLKAEGLKVLSSLSQLNLSQFGDSNLILERAISDWKKFEDTRSLASIFQAVERQMSTVSTNLGNSQMIGDGLLDELASVGESQGDLSQILESTGHTPLPPVEKEPAFEPELETIQEERERHQSGHHTLKRQPKELSDDEDETAQKKPENNGHVSTESGLEETKRDGQDSEKDVQEDSNTTSTTPNNDQQQSVEQYLKSDDAVSTTLTQGSASPPKRTSSRRGTKDVSSIDLQAQSPPLLRPQHSLRNPKNSRRLTAQYLGSSMMRLPTMPPLQAAQSLSALSTIRSRDLTLPLYRKDIFYSGSIRHLPQLKAAGSNYDVYRTSTVSIPHRQLTPVWEGAGFGGGAGELDTFSQGGDYESKPWYTLVPSSIRHVLMEMLGLKLLKDPVMLLLCFSNVFGMMGFYCPFVFLPNYAEELGISPQDASFLLAFTGISNTVGRVVFGWLSDKRWIEPITINNIGLLSCSILTCLIPLFNSYPLLVFYALGFGFSISSYVSLTSIILVDFLGLDRLSNSFGLLLLFRGMFTLFGSPIAGLLYDKTKTYVSSFIFSGVMFLISSLLSFLVPVLSRHLRKNT